MTADRVWFATQTSLEATEPMRRNDLQRTTAGLSYLRGLLLVPAGLVLILSALANSNVGPLRDDWAFLLGLGIAGLACLPIARFYREHYGRMSPSARQQARDTMAFAAAPAVMFGGALLLRSRAEWSLDLPVNAIAVAFAGVMLISYAAGAGIRAHHIAIWGGLLVAGGVPLWDGPDPSNAGLVMAGVAVIASGALDHLLLVRTFGSPRDA
jgi:hypothetical protein